MFKKKKAKYNRESKVCLLIAGVFALLCLFPIWVAFCASLSEEADLIKNGYPLWIPENASFDAYRYLLMTQGRSILRAFKITGAVVVLGTLSSMAIMICYAYSAAQKEEVFPFANSIAMIAWFTTIFNGGVLPWYILCTRYYGLTNTVWGLFIPSAMSAFHMFLLRNSFKAVPAGLIEAAKIDGAGHLKILFSVVLPLSKVGLVTVGMFTVLRYWNDFNLSLYLGTKREYYTVQRLLYNMLTNLVEMFNNPDMMTHSISAAPNTARMALAIITIVPIVVVYPFAQKYMAKGMNVGAIKG